jgi:hypothetical protein
MTRVLKSLPGVLIATVLLACVIEGCSSTVQVVRALLAAPPLIRERLHTTYDPDLGWVNIPNKRAIDLYGDGKSLTINRQGFRNDREITPEIPVGRVRVICSGDSFTLGYGVDDADTWCQQLIAEEPRLETVNMGQGGYGIDQAYLWYARDAAGLDHDAQVFALIVDDIHRMMYRKFFGYDRPRLALRGGELVVTNTPVSKLSYRFPWLAQNGHLLRGLRIVELLGGSSERGGDPAEEEALVVAIVERLQALHQRRGSELLIVLLPKLDDYDKSDAQPWRALLERELGKRHIAYLDLIAAMRKLDRALVPRLFDGHYSDVGNRWAASQIAEAIRGLPRVRRRLEALGATPAGAKPWRTRIYRSAAFEGESIVLQQRTPSLDWKLDPTTATVDTRQYAVRWDGCLGLDRARDLPLSLGSDDGSRVFVDGKLALDNWGDHAFTRAQAVAHLEPGRHQILVEYYQIGGNDAFDFKADLGAALVPHTEGCR